MSMKGKSNNLFTGGQSHNTSKGSQGKQNQDQVSRHVTPNNSGTGAAIYTSMDHRNNSGNPLEAAMSSVRMSSLINNSIQPGSLAAPASSQQRQDHLQLVSAVNSPFHHPDSSNSSSMKLQNKPQRRKDQGKETKGLVFQDASKNR